MVLAVSIDTYDASYTNQWLVSKYYSARWYRRENRRDGRIANMRMWSRVMIAVSRELQRRGCVWNPQSYGRWEGPGINGAPMVPS